MMNHGPTRLIFDSSVQRRSGGGGGGSSRVGSMLFLGSADDGGWGAAAAEELGRRRPFYTVAGDEMWDDDYYDEQQQEKKRRLTPEQVDILEKSFEAENKLEPERKSDLAKKLGLQPRQVAVWFQNRRARWKTKQLENDFDRLKSSYDSLRADHDCLLKDNNCLHAQLKLSLAIKQILHSTTHWPTAKNMRCDSLVVMLTEKLQQKEAAELAMGLKQADQDHSGEDREATLVQNSPSTGSGGSEVLGQRVAQFVDSSGESYFQDSCYHDVDLVANRIHSEEDDGSDDGCSYLPAVFEEHDHQDHEAVYLNYSVWD